MPALIILKQGREKPVANQHPWVFSGAIESTLGDPKPGDIVTVVNHKREFMAHGYYNPRSQIVVRLLTWEDEPLSDAWWRDRLARAIAGRAALAADEGTNAYRLVNAENDYLPGLIVDRYGDYCVLQALTLGIDMRKALLANLVLDLLPDMKGVYERSDVDVRGKEGLKNTVGVLAGAAAPENLTVLENGLTFLVGVQAGQKTGFYLDQRENRQLLRQLAAERGAQAGAPLRVLNLFSYTGGFGLYALSGGAAQVVNVDSSYEALETAEQIALANNPAWAEQSEYVQANVFEYLRDMRDNGERYDVIVLDPPKFAQNAQQVERAARGYKDLNLNAFHVAKPGGILMTFSCSGAITPDLFQKIVFGALADSGRQAQILRGLGPGSDHPVALTFPEGAYLKGLLLRVY